MTTPTPLLDLFVPPSWCTSYAVVGMIPERGRNARWVPWRRGCSARPVIWCDLRPEWPRLETAAKKRHDQKLSYGSTRLLNGLPHHLSVLGESVYAALTGVGVNLATDKDGDDGTDFCGCIDVKGCQYWSDPYLKHQHDESAAEYFVLVGVILEKRLGYLAGWATRDQMLSAQRMTWSDKPQASLHVSQLNPGMPPLHTRAFQRLVDDWERLAAARASA